jgi:hypothetical protein
MVRKRAAGKILLHLPGSCVPWIIREYDVPENLAQRLEGYFTEGAKDSGLMSASGSIMMNTTITGTSTVTARSNDQEAGPSRHLSWAKHREVEDPAELGRRISTRQNVATAEIPASCPCKAASETVLPRDT